MMILLFLGLAVGGFLGIVLMAILAVGKREDEMMEKMFEDLIIPGQKSTSE
ncbi:MAG: hypothetical protein HY758_07190 [Nitrospirae bacterium]|nr:hypothetical protein [Nitrospirota bacterium]